MNELRPIDKKFCCSMQLGESATLAEFIGKSVKTNISLWIHCERKCQDDFYIKIFNDVDFMKATKCSRIKIFKSAYKNRPKDDLMDEFLLTREQILSVLELLKRPLYDNKSTWECVIDSFIHFSHDMWIKIKLMKIRKNIPDYTKL